MKITKKSGPFRTVVTIETENSHIEIKRNLFLFTTKTTADINDDHLEFLWWKVKDRGEKGIKWLIELLNEMDSDEIREGFNNVLDLFDKEETKSTSQ